MKYLSCLLTLMVWFACSGAYAITSTPTPLPLLGKYGSNVKVPTWGVIENLEIRGELRYSGEFDFPTPVPTQYAPEYVETPVPHSVVAVDADSRIISSAIAVGELEMLAGIDTSETIETRFDILTASGTTLFTELADTPNVIDGTHGLFLRTQTTHDPRIVYDTASLLDLSNVSTIGAYPGAVLTYPEAADNGLFKFKVYEGSTLLTLGDTPDTTPNDGAMIRFVAQPEVIQPRYPGWWEWVDSGAGVDILPVDAGGTGTDSHVFLDGNAIRYKGGIFTDTGVNMNAGNIKFLPDKALRSWGIRNVAEILFCYELAGSNLEWSGWRKSDPETAANTQFISGVDSSGNISVRNDAILRTFSAYPGADQQDILTYEDPLKFHVDVDFEGEASVDVIEILDAVTPGDVTNKLYRVGSILHWNGAEIGGALPSNVIVTGDNISLLANDSGFITDDTEVHKNHIVNEGDLGFDWGDDDVSNDLTVNGYSLSTHTHPDLYPSFTHSVVAGEDLTAGDLVYFNANDLVYGADPRIENQVVRGIATETKSAGETVLVANSGTVSVPQLLPIGMDLFGGNNKRITWASDSSSNKLVTDDFRVYIGYSRDGFTVELFAGQPIGRVM